MDILLETDIGRDPDDFFALCYLISAGVNVRAITISPGDADQVAVAKLVCDEAGLDIPIGVGKLDRQKQSTTGVHREMLAKYGRSLDAVHDGFGADIVEDTLNEYPDCEIFAIGPITSVGTFFGRHPGFKLKRATMQGGFLSYDLHDHPCRRLEKFEGRASVATFNLNGDVKNAWNFLNADIEDRRFVSKNVCHTVVYTKKTHEGFVVKDRTSEIFDEAMKLYLAKHSEKKFHDPTAAACHLHPEIATWVEGNLFRERGTWGTELVDGADHIIADINYDSLWDHVLKGV